MTSLLQNNRLITKKTLNQRQRSINGHEYQIIGVFVEKYIHVTNFPMSETLGDLYQAYLDFVCDECFKGENADKVKKEIAEVGRKGVLSKQKLSVGLFAYLDQKHPGHGVEKKRGKTIKITGLMLKANPNPTTHSVQN